MRIVKIWWPQQWTAEEVIQDYLKVPERMNLAEEQKKWFALGGDGYSTFSEYLIDKGARKLEIEGFSIDYI